MLYANPFIDGINKSHKTTPFVLPAEAETPVKGKNLPFYPNHAVPRSKSGKAIPVDFSYLFG